MKRISKLQSHCAKMTLADKSRHYRHFQQVTHKGGEPAMNYINIFQNSQDLSASVGNNYSENQLVYIFLENFHQSGKYSAQIDSYQEELRRKLKFTNQQFLSFLSFGPLLVP